MGRSSPDGLPFGDFSRALLLVPVATLLLGIPTIGIFVVTWRWLGTRERL
jgi:hypothetical protein